MQQPKQYFCRNLLCTIAVTMPLIGFVGCEKVPSHTSAIEFTPGERIRVLYTIGDDGHKYKNGDFVSMDDEWIVIDENPDTYKLNSSVGTSHIRMKHVYMIRSDLKTITE